MIGVDFNNAEAPFRHDGGERGKTPMRLMKTDECGDIDIADAVAMGHHEAFTRSDEGPEAREAPARHRRWSGIDKRYFPRFQLWIVIPHTARRQVNGQIAFACAIVEKPLLYRFTLIAEANDEVMEPIVRVDFHDMPQNRHTTNFHHRLRAHMRLFREPCAETACEDDYFHGRSPRSEERRVG